MTQELRGAFVAQAGSCEALDSPFMGRLLRLLASHWPTDTKLAAKCARFRGDIGPMGASLPLRISGGLHALVLNNTDADLVAAYPPHGGSDAALWQAVNAALHRHDQFLCDWINNAPQTNEVRRAAVLIATAQLLTDRYNLPLHLSELGASGGLNLMFDKFRLELGADPDQHFGPTPSPVTLSPDWTGTLPPAASVTVGERRGVDLNPLDAAAPEDAKRLLAYLWADQPDRLTRTRAAIALQAATVDRADAIEWLQSRLTPRPGAVHLIYHTIAWQYFPPAAQSRGQAMIARAAAAATTDAPLAWLSYEADGQAPGAALRLRLWPGNHDLALGRADFHGRWIQWSGPSHLP